MSVLGGSVLRTTVGAHSPRVVVISLRMWTHHAAYESVIAHALRLRGAGVVLLTRGGGQPICEVGWGRRVWPGRDLYLDVVCDRILGGGEFYLPSELALTGS